MWMDTNKDFQDIYFQQYFNYFFSYFKVLTHNIGINSKDLKFVLQTKTDIKNQICNTISNKYLVKLKL
jgi:hypothetical protein